ncbi:hypothetical protein PoB_004888800 [Plakobranchus ocellatus]|uniref:Uncharacterized protein n=1 Tax=Plakobranchus ocellatus TaxID=259542 RepID=A0AAV4BT58_9GAST|nr:hypothetical protein PoB_004888800 [Plakobranchus ocellatus]
MWEGDEKEDYRRACIVSPQQGDLRLSGPPSGQGAGGGAQTRDKGVSADLRAASVATVPPMPPIPLTASAYQREEHYL